MRAVITGRLLSHIEGVDDNVLLFLIAALASMNGYLLARGVLVVATYQRLSLPLRGEDYISNHCMLGSHR